MIKKHQTPLYIYNRIKQIVYQKMNPEMPWMVKDAVKIIEQLIKPSDVGLEFGSGRSTKFFAQRCKHLISIEHNEEWYEIVKFLIKGYNNVDYRLLSLNINPENSDYFRIINEFKEETLDFIINDGKYRDLIAAEGIKKLKPGGFFILDNAERYLQNNFHLPEQMVKDWNSSSSWKYFRENTEHWRKIWLTDGVSSTMILLKSV